MSPLRGRSVLASLALVALLGCGAGAVSSVHLDGRFILEREPARGAFAITPRVRKVDQQITELLGHPVTFAFDAALVPRWELQLESLSEEAIAAVARRLSELKAREPAMFAWTAPNLRRIEWDYSATSTYATYDFDPDARRLRIVLATDSPRVIDDAEIGFAFGRAYARALGSRFARMAPGAVPASDRKAYAEWLFDFAYGEEKAARPPKGDDEELDAPRARVLERLVRFHASVAADVDLEKATRARIMEDAKWLASTERNAGEARARLPESHEFRRVEADFAAWLRANEERLTVSEHVTLVEELAASSDEDGRVVAFPGFDAIAHHLRTLDRWIKAGRPTGEREPRMPLFERVLGVFEIPPSDSAGCRSQQRPVYLAMKKDARVRQRVIDDALARKDPQVVKVLMANVLALDSDDAALALWRATEKDDVAFRAATRILAGHTDRCRKSDRVYDETPRLWKAYPARRGLLAYLLRQFATEGYRQNFPKLFTPLTQAEFAATLDEDPDPVRELRSVWRDIGKGWSRTDVLLPRLDRWLTDDYKKRESWWADTVESMAVNLCAEKAYGELAKVHEWIERRVRARPSEGAALQAASDRSSRASCKE